MLSRQEWVFMGKRSQQVTIFGSLWGKKGMLIRNWVQCLSQRQQHRNNGTLNLLLFLTSEAPREALRRPPCWDIMHHHTFIPPTLLSFCIILLTLATALGQDISIIKRLVILTLHMDGVSLCNIVCDTGTLFTTRCGEQRFLTAHIRTQSWMLIHTPRPGVMVGISICVVSACLNVWHFLTEGTAVCGKEGQIS